MRILLIEDEQKLARLLEQAIREAGLSVDVANDGEQGLELGLGFDYDAVVLDLLLPKRHGFAVLKELRSHKPALPILVVSALDQLDERIDGLDRGADDYLTKPFAIQELIARLRALLRRAGARLPSSQVQIADLEVDLAAHTVRRGGRRIDLTPREYALLVLFVNRRGQLLSRAEIGERVVDREFESTSNLIDVSVYGLRKKLGDPPLIVTVRGVGYRLDAPEGG